MPEENLPHLAAVMNRRQDDIRDLEREAEMGNYPHAAINALRESRFALIRAMKIVMDHERAR